MQFGEQLGIRQGLSGCGGSAAEVPLLLSGSKNPEWPGRGRFRLGHGQLLGRPPKTGLCAHRMRVCASLSPSRCALCASASVLLLCTDFSDLFFYLPCRAWKPKAPSTLAGPPLRLALYPIIMTARSRPTMPSPSDSTVMTTTFTLTASCVTGKTKPYG